MDGAMAADRPRSLDDLSPDQRAEFERVAKFTRMDPLAVEIINRAAEVARRHDEGDITVTVKDVLEALLHCTITPGLLMHLQRARSITEDEAGNEVVYLDDLAVLAAQLDDSSLVRQILERHVDDINALIADVRRGVRDHGPAAE
jgi:hypothetical protein